MRDLKDGIRSHVRIDFFGRVHKHFRGSESAARFASEVAALKVLAERGCKFVPQLIESFPEELYIITTNCGQPASSISKEKADALFAELERDFGVRHADQESRNITYNPTLGRFCLIDFEMAEILDWHGLKPSEEKAE